MMTKERFIYHLYSSCITATTEAVEAHECNTDQEITAYAVNFLHEFLATFDGTPENGMFFGDELRSIVDRMAAKIAADGLP